MKALNNQIGKFIFFNKNVPENQQVSETVENEKSLAEEEILKETNALKEEAKNQPNQNWSQKNLTENFIGNGKKRERNIINGSIWDKERCESAQKNNVEFPVNLPPESEMTIGLGDILPSTVLKVAVKEPNGEFREATRRGISGGFYYENGGYAKILNGGYAFKIVELRDKKSLRKIEKDFEDQYKDSLKDIEDFDQSIEMNGKSIDEKELIFDMALRYGIDPLFLVALRKQENGAIGQEFGIQSANAQDYMNQLNMAARSIQNSMDRYQTAFGKDPQEGEHLSVEFITFFSIRYCPPELDNLNENHLPGLLKMYGKYIGKESEYVFKKEIIQSKKEAVMPQIASGLRVRGKITASSFLTKADTYLGTPYVWGGSTKNGIDCSGFVLLSAGSTVIGDTTAAGLRSLSRPVSRQNVKPGDALFWNDGSHIAIIEKDLGNGTYQTIEAAKGPGKVLRTTRSASGKTVGRLPFIEPNLA